MHMHTRARNSPLVLVRMCNPQIRGGGVLKSAFTRIYCADRPTDPLSGHRATPVGSLRPTDSRRAQRGQSFGSVRPTDRPPRAARRGRFGGRMDRPTDPPRGPALTLRHLSTSHRPTPRPQDRTLGGLHTAAERGQPAEQEQRQREGEGSGVVSWCGSGRGRCVTSDLPEFVTFLNS